MRNALGVMMALFLPLALSFAAEAPSRFDMGPGASPVMEGCVAVTESSVYRPERGYGWLKAASDSFSAAEAVYRRYASVYPRESSTEPADDLLIDGVADSSDMVFQVDLPNGKYWVFAYLGDLSGGRYKLGLDCNGQAITERADAFTYYERGSPGPQAGGVGGVYRVRFVTDVKDDKLAVRFRKARGRKPSDNVFGDYGGLKGGAANQRSSKFPADASQVTETEPFSKNSVLGLEVYPYKPLPLKLAGGRLETELRLNRTMSGAIEEYNLGHYEAADTQASALVDKLFAPTQRGETALSLSGEERLALAELLLALAGRPETYDELALTQKAGAVLSEYLTHVPEDPAALYLSTSVYLMETAIRLRNQDFEALGVVMRSSEGQWAAESMLRQISPEDPLYLKSLIYIARMNCGSDPMGSSPAASYRGYKIWFDLKERFPDNKYVNIYLRGVDSIADRDVYARLKTVKTQEETERLFQEQLPKHPPRRYDWGYEGAPDWACALRDGLGWVTDIAEWWMLNRQRADGSMNAYGWSDDVELLRSWSKLATIGHSDIVGAGVTKLAEGAWNSASMDRQWGIESGRADVEHITEMVADTLPHMIYLDYGNPAYIERSMATVKSIRDFFTKKNERGWRLFRSVNVGPNWIDPDPHEAVDSVYAHRLGQVGLGLMWYSENPEAVRTFAEWADAWVEAAKLSEKGKPAGFLPVGIAFETGDPGYPDGAQWYDAPYNRAPDYTQCFIRQNLAYNMLQSVYRITGNPQYLEPIDAAFALAEAYRQDPKQSAEMGSAGWVAKNLATGADFSSVLAKTRMYTGTDAYDEFLRGEGLAATRTIFYDRLLHFGEASYLRYLMSGNKDCITFSADTIGYLIDKRGIEMVTTECVMTDRVGLGGTIENCLYGPFTGGIAGWGGIGMPNFAVRWENLGRHVAVLVQESGRDELRLLAYNFGPEDRLVGMRLWQLAPGGKYLLTQGPDADGDDVADSIALQESFELEHRGDIRNLELPVGEVQVIAIKQTAEPTGALPMVDVGVSSADIGYESGVLTVDVHNLGNEPVQDLRVLIYDGPPAAGELIAEQVIANLKAPVELIPRTATLGFEWLPEDRRHVISVVLDPDNELAEITESNNVVTHLVPSKLPEWKRPKDRSEGFRRPQE